MHRREGNRWVPRDRLLGGVLKYTGKSIASECTYHYFPSYNFMFDIGCADLPNTAATQVFITHGHNDHCGGVAKHLLRRDIQGLPPATYWVDEELQEPLQQLMDATGKLARATYPTQIKAFVDPVPVGGGMSISRFRSFHRIPCHGYLATSTRNKLKPEYHGLPPAEIKSLRDQGVQVTDAVVFPEVAFCGDTNIRVLTAEPWLLTTRVLILECTGMYDAVTDPSKGMDPDKVYRAGHIHLDHLVEFCKDNEFKNEVLVLTHFSARYDIREIEAEVAKRLPHLVNKIVII